MVEEAIVVNAWREGIDDRNKLMRFQIIVYIRVAFDIITKK